MKFVFLATPRADAAGPLVKLVEAGNLPPDLDTGARFTGKAGQLHDTFQLADGKVSRVTLLGTGEPTAADRESGLERSGAALAAKYLCSGHADLAIDLRESSLDAPGVAALLMGMKLRGWRYDRYRTRLPDDQKPTLQTVQVIGAPDGVENEWRVAQAVAHGVELARELVTEPANVIYPASFVERVRPVTESAGITVRALGRDQMAALGMGALLGVAQGSLREPQLLVMEWHGGNAGERPTAFVGKGVTFDTGGISLKPAAGMEDMKWDMGGAAAVAGAMLAIAGRKATANVIGVCGLVENMPDGGAQRPGDVITSMSGQTVEVINTDAEGRLVLCDALTWVQKEYDPVAVIDLATLTGAMIISLGHEHGGIFSNDDPLADALIKAGKDSGEKLWRFPLAPAYDKLIDSPIADIKNVGPREGGSITAAQFLQRFIDKDRPWAHLDIAGMVWAAKPGATWDKGATGYGVRLLDCFVRERLEGSRAG